jgi:zinc protease
MSQVLVAEAKSFGPVRKSFTVLGMRNRAHREPPTPKRLRPSSVGILGLILSFSSQAFADDKPAPKVEAQAPAQQPQTTANSAAAPLVSFTKYKLKNGLTVILHEDHSLPLTAVNIWYHVGPANEPPKRSGFAHLFEHLMFESSKHVGAEFDRLLESIGATNVNGTTSWDRTNYFETVPRQHLELVLWLESDRMGFMSETLTQERLDVQRDVVKNERRQSYENAPYGPSSLALLNTLFPAGHPYHGAIIGSMEDLSAATLSDVKDFFRAYYAPSNATLAIAGDIDVAKTKAMIARYFEGLPDRPRPQQAHGVTPALPAPVRLVVDEPVQLAQVSYGYRTPPAYTPDDPILDVTMAILAGGKATRLYQKLVVEKKLASDVSASLESNQLCSMAVLSATVASGKTVEDVERELDAALAELEKNGPNAAELHRAKRRIEVAIMNNLERLNDGGGESGRAGMLQRLDHYVGDPGHANAWLAELRRVSADDVRRVVGKHLKASARATIVTRPTAAKGAE